MRRHFLRRTMHVVLAIAVSSVVIASTASANSSGDVGVAPATGVAPAVHVAHYAMAGPAVARKKKVGFLTVGLLTNNNAPGRPVVMKSSRVHLFFWQDPLTTAPFPAGYVNGIIQYFRDVAHDSGRKSNVYSLAKQYGAKYKVSLPKLCQGRRNCARGWIINDDYPNAHVGDCTVTVPFTACLTDDDLTTELEHIRTTRLPFKTGRNDISFIFLPPNVDTCDGGCYSTLDFCAYHSAYASGSGVVYANMPYLPGNPSCEVGQYPQGSLLTTPGDGEYSTISHEHNEAITDPFPGSGWFNGDLSHENGDQCAYTYDAADATGYIPASTGTGSVRGPAGQFFNQVIHHHRYLLQEEWSNKGFRRSGIGCYQHASRRA